jgi:hypothetical protein
LGEVGVKAEAYKKLAEVLVVDRLERPFEN